MPPVIVLAADLLVVLCPFLLRRLDDPDWVPQVRLLPALPLVAVVLLVAFVLGEDSYRRHGISRWNAYRSPGGALGPMFAATVVLMSLAAGAMIVAVVQHRPRLMRTATLGAAAIALLLGVPTAIGFSSN